MCIYKHTSEKIGDIYLMNIKMNDNNILDGYSSAPYFRTEDSKSKTATFSNLNKKVKEYYENYNVLPDKEKLDLESTEKYQLLCRWINENISSKYQILLY